MKLKLRKMGMTSKFTEKGRLEPCTLLQLPKTIAIKKQEQTNNTLLFVETTRRMTNPTLGEIKKFNIEAKKGIFFEVSNFDAEGEIDMNIFKDLKYVSVRGKTKGKGFAGVMKRHNFEGGRASHGNSLAHRTPGSTGQRQDPGRVMKGKKMPGHMGNTFQTIQNLRLLDIDYEQRCIVVKGGVPGNVGALLDVTIGRRK